MNTCHGCDSALPEGAAYCPRCGLAAGAPAPQLPAWRPEPARRPATSKPAADVWAGPPDAPVADRTEVLTAERPGPDRRRRILIAAVALLALVVGAIVGIDQFGGGGRSASSPTQAPITSLPAEVQGGGVSPIFPGQNDLVRVAPGVEDSPALASTVELLTRYFTAINSHRDYEGWARTLVPHPGRATTAEYAGYRTTIDSDVYIHGIAVTRESNLRVDVSFVSRQDPRPGSLHNCTSWEISYTMVPSPVAGLRIDLVSSDQVSALDC